MKGDANWDAVWEFLWSPASQVVISVSILAILTVVGYYLVRRTRESMDFSTPSANELLTEFRQSREDERMSELEFRRIKQTLGEKIRHEAMDTGRES